MNVNMSSNPAHTGDVARFGLSCSYFETLPEAVPSSAFAALGRYQHNRLDLAGEKCDDLTPEQILSVCFCSFLQRFHPIFFDREFCQRLVQDG